jgi:hypothetical protein
MTLLAETFRRLAQPTSDRTLTAAPLASSPSHKIAKDHTGAPCLLLTVKEQQRRTAPIQLEHLSIEHNTRCTIQVDQEEQEGHFTIIRCQDAPTGLQQVFLRVAAPLVDDLPDIPTASAINDILNAVIELFRATAQPPTKTLQGLWAELFLIAQATDQAVLVGAWHATPDDRFDFVQGPDRIEVKSTSGRIRQHYFSLEQLTPPQGTRVLIVSIFTERSAGGPAIADLLDRITKNRPASLQARLNRITHVSLGNTWREAETVRFDMELAAESLRFFDSSAVPGIRPPIPPGVTEVRFRADLTNATSLSREECHTAGLLFAAASTPP